MKKEVKKIDMDVKKLFEKRKYLISFIAIIILVIFFSPIRYCTFIWEGNPGSSFTMEEAKKLDVFLCEYIPDKRKIVVVDNEFNINNVWTELLWVYSDDLRYPNTYQSYKSFCNLIINTGRNSLAKHGIEWKFEGFYPVWGDIEYGHTINNDLKKEEYEDTIRVKILKFNKLTEDFTDSIGVLTLVKGECAEETD